ncbi:MAG: hypothetical protein N3D82_05865 [Ignisphaera sp.]|nr:hypothetical protein [Ignisphaera sp.]MCX8168531.1 hypothetical protein [Ignisphaera sp.]MDW8085030.1 hypothetical protein [Ignisphaera sp.]
MENRKIECPVCGRIFHKGQGIKIAVSGQELIFHSKSCAIKFFKSLVLYLDQKNLEDAARMVIKEFEDRLNEVKEKRKKKLETL